jgi:hypothetical protein
MWAKNFSTAVQWAPEEGLRFLKKDIVEGPIWATKILPFSKKVKEFKVHWKKIRMIWLRWKKRY